EPENFARLNRMIAKHGLSSVVETIQAVAAEQEGELKLELNSMHPADHKIATTGIAVTAHTIDDLLAKRNCPAVSLIKIDVQGAEERVLRGATRTLEKSHPALFIEIDDRALAAMGSSADRLF